MVAGSSEIADGIGEPDVVANLRTRGELDIEQVSQRVLAGDLTHVTHTGNQVVHGRAE